MTDGPPEPQGRLQPVSPGALTMFVVVGLVGGWLVRPSAERLSGTAPLVSWLQVLVLFFAAALLAASAWFTHRAVTHERPLLEPHWAVNRLVLARASALVGALVAGGYAGYAVSWLGLGAELAGLRVWRSLVAAAAGVTITIAALLLERACRIRSGDDHT
ncbi:DUF3180 domain-containing protein [Nocardioides sp.]|uniref:DUF3180 domain-containing protein n=1 Tax=Nocardioides sp. TaxID=35761 RepID=UPI002736498D|nr:DUF3180 domain-containing protein [Nocardioides sp.]MDP3892606.1 DUF3180 domain-containing protein [Nocardioides sp.]